MWRSDHEHVSVSGTEPFLPEACVSCLMKSPAKVGVVYPNVLTGRDGCSLGRTEEMASRGVRVRQKCDVA